MVDESSDCDSRGSSKSTVSLLLIMLSLLLCVSLFLLLLLASAMIEVSQLLFEGGIIYTAIVPRKYKNEAKMNIIPGPKLLVFVTP